MYSPAHILAHAATSFGDRRALITDTRTLTYTELDAASNAVANALSSRGITNGHVVSLYSQNRWEWIVAYHGALKAGAIVNPVNVMLTPDELRYVLRDCSSRAVFVAGHQAEQVRDLTSDLTDRPLVIDFDDTAARTLSFVDMLDAETTPPQVAILSRTEPCTIGYTSGTTGHPKGAVQSHQAVHLNCALTATMHGRTGADTVVTALPAPHVYGNVAINSTFLVGGTVVLMERFTPEAALELIASHHATMFEGVPAMYAMLLAHPDLPRTNLTSLTRCTVGGQTMPTVSIDRWQTASGSPLLELWGMTELSGLGLTHAVHAPPAPGSAGVSMPGIDVRIADLDDNTRTANTGEPGELLVRGPLVMLEYHNNPAATAETITPDGWLRTGDIATIDDTGHVYIIDRRKDMIITGGYNIYPAEIERVLAEHPDVALVAAGPVPDDVKGELACAYVVLTPTATATEADLINFTTTHLAAYKRPRVIRFVDRLPTTSSGKIMRRQLINEYPASAAI